MAQNKTRRSIRQTIDEAKIMPQPTALPEGFTPVSNGLLTAIYTHLSNGGTRLEADMLKENIAIQSNEYQSRSQQAAQRSAELEQAKAQAVAEYKASQLN